MKKKIEGINHVKQIESIINPPLPLEDKVSLNIIDEKKDTSVIELLIDIERLKLNKKDAKIIDMLIMGYHQKEIIMIVKTNYPYIKRLQNRIYRLLVN